MFAVTVIWGISKADVRDLLGTAIRSRQAVAAGVHHLPACHTDRDYVTAVPLLLGRTLGIQLRTYLSTEGCTRR